MARAASSTFTWRARSFRVWSPPRWSYSRISARTMSTSEDTMRALVSLSFLLTQLASCKPLECGPGTLEKNGTCVPADELVETATCGPNTMLEGGQCVPTFQPTECDDETTVPELDTTTGVITCIGTAAGF